VGELGHGKDIAKIYLLKNPSIVQEIVFKNKREFFKKQEQNV
jgi:hypothetical protein